MDIEEFDALSRSLATIGTRRGLLRLLGALPLFGVLLAVTDDEGAGARRRHNPQHNHAHKRQRQRTGKHERLHEQKKRHKKKRSTSGAARRSLQP